MATDATVAVGPVRRETRRRRRLQHSWREESNADFDDSKTIF